MPSLKSLTLVALVAASASAGWFDRYKFHSKNVELTFRRFSQEGCNEAYHIAKDTHLNDPHCKSFDDKEVPFHSFYAAVDEGNTVKYECEVTVYDQKDCKGNSYVLEGAYTASCLLPRGLSIC